MPDMTWIEKGQLYVADKWALFTAGWEDFDDDE